MVLFYVVVECPVVVFFLQYYVFEQASCRCVAAFECFSDDLPVERYCNAFQRVIQFHEIQRCVADYWQWIWLGYCFAFKQIDAFADFFQMIHFLHEDIFEYFACNRGVVGFVTVSNGVFFIRSSRKAIFSCWFVYWIIPVISPETALFKSAK